MILFIKFPMFSLIRFPIAIDQDSYCRWHKLIVLSVSLRYLTSRPCNCCHIVSTVHFARLHRKLFHLVCCLYIVPGTPVYSSLFY